MTTRFFFLFFFLFSVLWNGPAIGAEDLGSLLPPSPPDGWILSEGPRGFDRKTLYERINGQADLYLKYGFRKSVFAGYQDPKKPDLQVELDLYDMGKTLHAFGIFSRFRTGERPAGIGLDSDLGDSSLLFYKGNYFVMVYCTEPRPPLLKAFGEAVSTRIPGAAGTPKEIDYFPTAGLKPGSIQYLPEALLGLGFLKRGFQATYGGDRKPEREAALFVAVFESAKESQNALRAYQDHLRAKGKLFSKTPPGLGPRCLGGEDPYKGRVLAVSREHYLIGAVGFEKEEDAEGRLMEMIRRIR